MTSKPCGEACKALLVPGLLALAFGGIAFALDRFDRGYGDIRALCLLALGIVASVLQVLAHSGNPNSRQRQACAVAVASGSPGSGDEHGPRVSN